MSVNSDYGEEVMVRPPAHPVPTLQGPFEESMVESINEPSEGDEPLDAVTRRTILLDSPHYARAVAGRWKQRAGEKYHPLWKLVAQMSFGLHLLARNLAKSEDEVMKILQAHVDDIDGFLERTTEDFDLAQSDIYERLKCLKLPLQHAEVFDRMLEDRAFRASILEGNEKIEHIVSRTKRALKDALKDVQKGFDATNVLDKYIADLALTWERETPEHEAVFVAMLGNAEGWRRAFMELHLQGNKLAGTLKKLVEVVAEMERRAALVSRKQLAKSQGAKHLSNKTTSAAARLTTRGSQLHKPLPQAPSQTRPTRSSSITVQPLEESSPPSSVQKSSGRSSDSRPESRASNQLLSGRQTPNTTLQNVLQASQKSSLEQPRRRSIEQSIRGESDIPIELPADVPEEILRLAPVSVKNRLSMTLGLKSKDHSDHRISSIYYPRALGDLLKMPPSPRILLSPQQTMVRSLTPQTDDSDYFSAEELRSSVVLMLPETTKSSMDDEIPPGESSLNGEITALPNEPADEPNGILDVSSPGLTSHPFVLDMASPPTELPATSERIDEGDLRTRQSSLGEPGPEVSADEPDTEPYLGPNTELQRTIASEGNAANHTENSIRLANVKDSTPSAEKARQQIHPVELDAGAVMIMSGRATPVNLVSVESKAKPSHIPGPVDVNENYNGRGNATDRSYNSRAPRDGSVSNDTIQKIINKHTKQPTTPREGARSAGSGVLAVLDNAETQSPKAEAMKATRDWDQAPAFAELEATAPTQAAKDLPNSPVELEAPQQHFVLPPRSSAQTKETVALGKEGPQATIKERADFFKLPAEQSVARAMKPRDYRYAAPPEPIRPLRVQMMKVNNKLVAVEAAGPSSGNYGPPKRLSSDVISSMIEEMATVPLHTDIEERKTVSAPNSARIQAKRASDILAPPQSAPAPVGPSGRMMVHADYAEAAMFTGERKQAQHKSRHSASGSKGGLLDLLSGSHVRRHSSDGSSSKTGKQTSSGRQSTSAKDAGGDMLTSGGKDVLWFKNRQEHRYSAPTAGQQAVGVGAE